MEFDESPALCRTIETIDLKGASNCSWSSCREGCTKDVYDCTQIYVDYWRGLGSESDENWQTSTEGSNAQPLVAALRSSRGIRDYDDDYVAGPETFDLAHPDEDMQDGFMPNGFAEAEANDDTTPVTGIVGNDTFVYYRAKLFPNVKGCGYPPSLNCTVFKKFYSVIGKNFSCYYSKVDPGIVISNLDMWQVYLFTFAYHVFFLNMHLILNLVIILHLKFVKLHVFICCLKR